MGILKNTVIIVAWLHSDLLVHITQSAINAHNEPTFEGLSVNCVYRDALQFC